MKIFLQSTTMVLSLFIFGTASWAGSVAIPNTFTANATAVAADVNANFGAVKTAVDDNDGRITTNGTDIAALQATIATLQITIGNLQTSLADKAAASHVHAQSDISNLTNDIGSLQVDSVPGLGTYLSLGNDANGYMTALFSGVNIQVINGVTQVTPNGLGNLIVGYNMNKAAGDFSCSDGQYNNVTDCASNGNTWALNHKSGSHNIVAGNNNSYSQHSGVVFGVRNIINRAYAGVTGGANNTASGVSASVSGGTEVIASGDASSVSGGFRNTASSSFSSVSGGTDNIARGYSSSVSGGRSNIANGFYSSVSGGNTRTSWSIDDWAAGSLWEDF